MPVYEILLRTAASGLLGRESWPANVAGAIVVAPTRELAAQIAQVLVLEALSYYCMRPLTALAGGGGVRAALRAAQHALLICLTYADASLRAAQPALIGLLTNL